MGTAQKNNVQLYEHNGLSRSGIGWEIQKQAHTSYLVSSIGPIVSVVILHRKQNQNLLYKSRSIRYG